MVEQRDAETANETAAMSEWRNKRLLAVKWAQKTILGKYIVYETMIDLEKGHLGNSEPRMTFQTQ